MEAERGRSSFRSCEIPISHAPPANPFAGNLEPVGNYPARPQQAGQKRAARGIILRMAKSYRATFLKRKAWWVAWSEDVPGALTQGRTLAEAKANLRDAIRLMLEPVKLDRLPKARIVQDRVRV